MDLQSETWQKKFIRRLALILLIAASWAVLPQENYTHASDPQPSTEGPAVRSADAPKKEFWPRILQGIIPGHSRELMDVLGEPEFALLAFVALNLIVFVETGLLIGFFLPGDSLLVTAGVVCAASGWSLPLLLITLCLSAIIGDSIGYSIGFKTGPRIFNREKSFFFHKEHLLAAQKFYERHGGKTIMLARFMPIIRTFAPVVAGVGKMDYRRFLFFNIFGGVGWVISMIMIGYFLTSMINPLFMWLLGRPDFDVKDHIEKVIVIVVFLSISPGIIVWLKKKLQSKPAPEPVLAGKVGD
jgi:membrane-associated protein